MARGIPSGAGDVGREGRRQSLAKFDVSDLPRWRRPHDRVVASSTSRRATSPLIGQGGPRPAGQGLTGLQSPSGGRLVANEAPAPISSAISERKRSTNEAWRSESKSTRSASSTRSPSKRARFASITRAPSPRSPARHEVQHLDAPALAETVDRPIRCSSTAGFQGTSRCTTIDAASCRFKAEPAGIGREQHAKVLLRTERFRILVRDAPSSPRGRPRRAPAPVQELADHEVGEPQHPLPLAEHDDLRPRCSRRSSSTRANSSSLGDWIARRSSFVRRVRRRAAPRSAPTSTGRARCRGCACPSEPGAGRAPRTRRAAGSWRAGPPPAPPLAGRASTGRASSRPERVVDPRRELVQHLAALSPDEERPEARPEQVERLVREDPPVSSVTTWNGISLQRGPSALG